MPSRYVETAIRVLDNPDGFTNRQQVALMDARAEELFGQLSQGGHGDQFAAAVMLSDRLGALIKDKATQAQHEQLHRVLVEGGSDSAIWKELLTIWEDRRRAIDTDSKIQFRQRVALSQEQAAALAAIVIQAAFEVIPDEADRQRFADRVEAASPGGVRALTRGNYEVS